MWDEIPAKEFCASVRDGTHDSPKPVESGRFLITSRHIIGGQIDLSNAYLISSEDFEAINKRSKVDRWDVLISMIGTVGEPCLVREEPEFAIKNIGLFKTKGELDGKWLYYYLTSPQAQALIRQNSRGTTQAYVPLGALRDFPVRVPRNREVMRAITNVLGGLDEKIDLNRRTNQTLEAMAQAIFKSWFVDFDPVKAKIAAKAEGRDPLRAAMSAISGKAAAELDALPPEQYEQLAATAALFPEEMEESELGEIPKCWRCETFGTIAELSKGSVNPLLSPERVFEHYSLPAFDAGKQPVVEEGVQIKSNKTKFARGAVLQSKLNPHIPRVWFPLRVSENAVCSTEFLPWIAKEPASPSFVYCLLTSDLFGVQVRSLVTGTSNSHQRVKPDQVSGLLTVVPSDGLLSAFTRTVTPFFERIESGTNQIRDLAGLRDVLLPKLLSGELQVQHTELEVTA